jgi:multiple sugar transport system substrate-binding protein
LALVQTESGPAAVPHDGYHQLLLYRADWFEERGLQPPDNYAAMATAAERIFDREAIISGLIIPTESNLVTTHQAFEQMALANGCRLIDESENVTILEPACAAALDHYYTTINRFSPPGVQTDTSARVGFLDGRTGVIMTSPDILPALAGLDPGLPAGCDECAEDAAYLAANTGILTALSAGSTDAPVAFGNLNYLGITPAADRETAKAFVEFWYEQAYPRWLAVESERKVPMRLGTAEDPRRYIDAWGTEPLPGSDRSLTDLFGQEVVAMLRDGIAAAPRWGFREGQGALMSRLYQDYTISIVLQEMLSGYFSPERTLEVANRRVLEHIPGALPPTPAPEATIDPAETPTTTP